MRTPATMALVLHAGCTCGGFEPLDSHEESDTPIDTRTGDSEPPDTDACADHCQDGAFDCGETAIDCGGECEPCAEQTVFGGNGGFPAVAATGDLVLVVYGNGDDSHRSTYSCSEGDGWTAPVLIPGLGSNAEFARLDTDAEGRVHMAVHAGGGNGRQVYYLRFEGDDCAGSWTSPVAVDDGTDNSCWPQIALDAAGDPHISWTDRDYYAIHYNHAVGDLWQGIETVIESELQSCHGDLTVVEGTAHLVWQEGDSPRLPVHSQHTGSGFAAPVELSGSFHNWPQIVGDTEGRLHAIYTDRYSPHPVQYRRRVGQHWEEQVQLSSRDGEWTWPGLTLDDQGGLHATWHRTEGMEHVYYARGDTSSGSWESARQVSTSDARHNRDSTISIDPNGVAHLVWLHKDDATDADTTGEVHYRAVTWDDLSP